MCIRDRPSSCEAQISGPRRSSALRKGALRFMESRLGRSATPWNQEPGRSGVSAAPTDSSIRLPMEKTSASWRNAARSQIGPEASGPQSKTLRVCQAGPKARQLLDCLPAACLSREGEGDGRQAPQETRCAAQAGDTAGWETCATFHRCDFVTGRGAGWGAHLRFFKEMDDWFIRSAELIPLPLPKVNAEAD